MNVDIKVGSIEVSISDCDLTQRQIKSLISYVVQKTVELDVNDFNMQIQAHSLGVVAGMNNQVEH